MVFAHVEWEQLTKTAGRGCSPRDEGVVYLWSQLAAWLYPGRDGRVYLPFPLLSHIRLCKTRVNTGYMKPFRRGIHQGD